MKSKCLPGMILFISILGTAAAEGLQSDSTVLPEISFIQSLHHAISNNIDIRTGLLAVEAASGSLRNAISATDIALAGTMSFKNDYNPIAENNKVNSVLTSDQDLISEYIKNTYLETTVWLERISKNGIETKLSLSLNKNASRYSFNDNKKAHSQLSDTEKATYFPDDANTANVSFDLKIPLFKSFTNALNRNNIAQAKLLLAQQNLELQQTITDTVISVSNAYWSFVSAYLAYKNDIDSAQRLQDQLEKTKVLALTGAAAKTEILQLTAHIASKQTDITLGKDKLVNAIADLEIAAGYIPGTITEDTQIADTFPDMHFLDSQLSMDTQINMQFADKAIYNRLDTKILETGLKIAEKKYAHAKVIAMPDFDLTASIGYTGCTYANGLPEFFKSVSSNITGLNTSAGVLFKMNLPGNGKGSVLTAKSEYEQKKLEYETHVSNAERSIKLSYSKLYSMQFAVKNSHDVARMYSDLQIGTKKQFEAGLVTAENLNDSEDKYVDAKKQYYDCFKSYLESVLLLKKNTGIFFIPEKNKDTADVASIYDLTHFTAENKNKENKMEDK